MTSPLHSQRWRLDTRRWSHKLGSRAQVGLLLACTGALGCASKDGGSMFSAIDATSFKVSPTSGEPCSAVAMRAESSVSPSAAELVAKLGTGSSEFIVLMTEEIDLQQYPLPSTRDGDPAADTAWTARARAIAESQRCALSFLRASGGEYLESFVLINAISANLTAQQAIELGKRTDVRAVDLTAQSGAPLP